MLHPRRPTQRPSQDSTIVGLIPSGPHAPYRLQQRAERHNHSKAYTYKHAFTRDNPCATAVRDSYSLRDIMPSLSPPLLPPFPFNILSSVSLLSNGPGGLYCSTNTPAPWGVWGDNTSYRINYHSPATHTPSFLTFSLPPYDSFLPSSAPCFLPSTSILLCEHPSATVAIMIWV